MTDTIIANSGEEVNIARSELKRNRKIFFTPSHVIMDGGGGIIDRPLVRTPELPCFGRPHEYWRGVFDRPVKRHNADGSVSERDYGCAGCRVPLACQFAATQRRDSSPELIILHDEWETATDGMLPTEKYQHPTWAAFDRAGRAHVFADSHDAALEADKAKRAQREKDRRKKASKAKRKARPVPLEIRDAIDAGRDERAAILLRLRRKPGATRRVAKLSPEACWRTADVWAARELLERAGVKVTGNAVARQLVAWGRDGGITLAGLTSRSIETLGRIDFLEAGEAGSVPVWPAFTP